MPRVTQATAVGARTRQAGAIGRAGVVSSVRPNRVVSDRPRRWRLLLRRQRWMLRPAAWGAAGLCAAGLCVLAARAMQPGSTLAGLRERFGGAVNLRVQEVRIEGRLLTPEPFLRAALGVNTGDPLLGFSLEQARMRIENMTWVQHATVERRLPGTVYVKLDERRPFAIWQTGDKFVLVDRAGQEVAKQDPAKDIAAFAVLPLVVGPGAPAAAAALLDLINAQPELRSRVTAAVRVSERRWNLRLNTGAYVLLPEGAEAPAIAKLVELHSAQSLLDRPVQAIDLRLPDRLVVRPLAPSDAHPAPAVGGSGAGPGMLGRRPT